MGHSIALVYLFNHMDEKIDDNNFNFIVVNHVPMQHLQVVSSGQCPSLVWWVAKLQGFSKLHKWLFEYEVTQYRRVSGI